MNLTASALFASMLISTIGFGFFLYGKKSTRLPQLLAGLILMIGPCFTGNVTWMVLGSVFVIGALSIAVRAGL